MKKKQYGFTLIELLVVICVIAILVSLLLPSLSRVRAAGYNLKCMANLRTMGQAMTIYAAENKGWIPGSGATSGRHIWKQSGSNCSLVSGYSIDNIPRVNEPLDWAGPLSRVMRKTDAALTGTDGKARFRAYLRIPEFRCPSYAGVVMTPSATTGGLMTEGAQPAIGYNTANGFLNLPNTAYPYGSSSGFPCNVVAPGNPYWVLPNNYVPKITMVGATSQKIFAADGARRVRTFSAASFVVEYTLSSDPSVVNTNESMFSDYGPFQCNTRSYSRSAVPGNGGIAASSTYDPRMLSFRHGTLAAKSKGGQFRMNVVFYDGHVENLDDITAANPNLWLPTGTVWTQAQMQTSDSSGTGTTVCYTDVYNKYMKYVTASVPFTAQ